MFEKHTELVLYQIHYNKVEFDCDMDETEKEIKTLNLQFFKINM